MQGFITVEFDDGTIRPKCDNNSTLKNGKL